MNLIPESSPAGPATVFLSLGSNLGDRLGHLRTALLALRSAIRRLRVSPVYETAPLYVIDQPPFLNLVAQGETSLSPPALLALAKQHEAAGGRVSGPRFGPRPIDIDILFYGTLHVATPVLEIPHPRLCERRFVLAPLADLAPEHRHPVTGQTIAALLAALPCDPAAVQQISPTMTMRVWEE